MGLVLRNLTSLKIEAWTPSAVVVDNPPAFTNNGVTAVTVGNQYSHTPAATDSDGDAVVITATVIPSWMTFIGGVLSGDSSSVTPGNYAVTLRATANGATVDQSFTVVVSSQAFTYPEDRVFQFASTLAPSLVVGDTFRGRGTFWAGVPSDVYGVGSASSISAAIISADHTKRYCEPVLQSVSVVGSDWVNGVIVVSLPKDITAQISAYIEKKEAAKVEIQVTVGGEDYTWFSPVQLIPGHI